MQVTLTVLSDKECFQMTKSNPDLSYRALVKRELCAAKKTTLTLRIFSEKRSSSSSSSEQEPGYSVIGSRQHFLWGGSDACQVTLLIMIMFSCVDSCAGWLWGASLHPDWGQGRAHRGGQQGWGLCQAQLCGSVRQVREREGRSSCSYLKYYQGHLLLGLDQRTCCPGSLCLQT